MLRAAKTGLTIFEISFLQKHFLENNWRRNVDHKPNKNSPSNILWLFALFKRYFQKYESTQVKVDGPVHARSKHARYMHNDAQQCNGPVQTSPLRACKLQNIKNVKTNGKILFLISTFCLVIISDTDKSSMLLIHQFLISDVISDLW